MFDEPDESQPPTERTADPMVRAREMTDTFRMHAELAAVFEGPRKFAAKLRAQLPAEISRELQQTIARLEKAKLPDTPVIAPEAWDDALRLLTLCDAEKRNPNDYHIHRRPGEAIIVRWLAGEQVETFYERLQAHFDAALNAYREEERQSQGWKQDPATLKYLEALDAVKISMAERYLRPMIREHKLFVLSTQTADEMDILHLCDHVMATPAAEVVGPASAPQEDGATERDRAWFFKLFSLRGMDKDIERMCLFAFLQKSDDAGW